MPPIRQSPPRADSPTTHIFLRDTTMSRETTISQRTKKLPVTVLKAPGWLQELRGTHKPETEEHGISSFVYRARRPFQLQRFFTLIQGEWPGVVRSKGFFWLASSPTLAGSRSQAGSVARHGPPVLGGRRWPTSANEKGRFDVNRPFVCRSDKRRAYTCAPAFGSSGSCAAFLSLTRSSRRMPSHIASEPATNTDE